MKLLAWNRAASDSASPWDLVKTIDPVGIFLMETKIYCGFLSRILKKLGFSYFLIVPPIGRK